MSQRNLLTSARHIAVEGPIGVGKTSLVRRLCEHLPADPLLEQSEANPFLANYYKNPQRYALQTQLFFLFQRLDQMRDLAQSDQFPRTVVCDYLMEKELLFASLTLSDDEYELYRQVYDRVSPAVSVVPDLVIFLQAQPETLIARVRKRGVDFEQKITDDYLTLICEGYTNFFHNYTAAPIMVVNSEHLNYADDSNDFLLLVQRIETMRGSREYFNRGN